MINPRDFLSEEEYYDALEEMQRRAYRAEQARIEEYEESAAIRHGLSR